VNEKTISSIGGFLTRFGPYLSLVAAVVAVVAFLPGDDSSDLATNSGAFSDFDSGDRSGSRSGTSDFSSGSGDFEGGTSGTGGGTGSGTVSTGGTGGGSGGGGGEGGGGDAAAPGGQSGGGSGVSGSAAEGKNCDPNTGRVATPSHYSPPCVPKFGGDNGGATHRGVTADSIKLAVMLVEGDAASEAALTAAGANDSEEQERQQYLEWVEYYSTHYETWGRTIDVTFYKGSGPATDDAAGRADAVRIANDGNFAVLNAPNNAFVDELVARGVMCMCTVSLPNSFYTDRAPFVWSTLMSSDQGYVHRAEFIGKRLAGAKAVHAGDPTMHVKDRVFGLAYYDDDKQSYRPGVDTFIKELRDNYGISLAAVVGFKGYPDVAASQEAARPLIQKMIAQGVTSVVCACDPFAPIFFTQEATRQNYRPEWIITGSALTDTAFFARTYDQTQWSNAFGVSFLTVGLPERLRDDYRKLEWHFGKPPTAKAGYSIIDAPTNIFFTGVHLAGPKLDPGTFRDGMFRAGPSATGMSTVAASSFGVDLWPFHDYTGLDDITLIWWDAQARGEDETGQLGLGLYRYIDGGKRYMPGQQPQGPVAAFKPEGTITGAYDDYPQGEAPPDYPPPR
jgi:hypothetical protein